MLRESRVEAGAHRRAVVVPGLRQRLVGHVVAAMGTNLLGLLSNKIRIEHLPNVCCPGVKTQECVDRAGHWAE